jgi:hypothetical protein
MEMVPVKIELPASTPRDLRDEFVAALEQLGPVRDLSAESFGLDTTLLVLAGISAAADLLATVGLLMAWRDKARRRGVPLDRVTIVAGDRRISLKDTDAQTLIRVLEGLLPHQPEELVLDA